MPTINDMPVEILCHILSHLEVVEWRFHAWQANFFPFSIDRIRLRRVCHLWKAIIEERYSEDMAEYRRYAVTEDEACGCDDGEEQK